jgi:hypothetical protein
MAVLKLDVTGKVTVTTQNSKRGAGLEGQATRARAAYHMKNEFSYCFVFLHICAIIASYLYFLGY